MRDYLYDFQRQFLNRSGQKKFLLGGRQCGKTVTLCVYGIEHAAKYGREVELIAPQKRMALEAKDRTTEITRELDREGKLPSNLTVNKDKLKFSSGGRIDFLKPRTGKVYDPDVLLLDEANMLSDTHKANFMPSGAFKHGPVLATGTPASGFEEVEYFTNKGFEVVPIPTAVNPNVGTNFIKTRRNEMERDRFKRTFLTGLTINEHWLSMYEQDGERTIKCPLCGFEETIALDHPDEAVATAEGYIYGKAQNVECE